VRDVAEAEGMTFTRCLDLMTALHLLQIERPQVFRSEDSFKAVSFPTMSTVAIRNDPSRRLRSSAGMRKYRPFADGLANGSYRPRLCKKS
jgi:hypothetical protein